MAKASLRLVLMMSGSVLVSGPLRAQEAAPLPSAGANDAATAQSVTTPASQSDKATAPADQASPIPSTSPSTSGNEIGDIVVTAQKREQSVQSVPIAISAFGGAALQERAVADVATLGNISPSTTFTAGSPFSGSTAVLSAFIRGIGSNEFSINLDPGVGVYLDGVYLARTIGANVDLPDVERVEILKGPQGTLFGRNTIGGAVSVVTRDPGSELAIRGSVTTGRYNRLDAQASLDLPLTDNLRSILTFAVTNRDGFQKRIAYPSSTAFVVDRPDAYDRPNDTASREGGDNSFTMRGKVRYDGIDRLRATFAGDYTRVDQSALNNSLLATLSTSGPFAGTAANNIPGTALDVTTGSSGFNLLGLYNFCISATPAQIAARNAQALCGPRLTPRNAGGLLPPLAGVNVDANPLNDRLPYDNRFISPDKDRTYATGNSFSKITSYSIGGTLEYELASTLSVKSITNYRHLDFAAGIDADASPLQILEPSFTVKQHQFSEEVQLVGSALDRKLNYVIGGYYFTESASERDFANLNDGLLVVATPSQQKTRNLAAFGQVDWRISELIGVTVGGRYTDERKRFASQIEDVSGFTYKLFNCPVYGPPCSTALGFPNPNDPLAFYPAGTATRKFHNFSPKVGVDLHPAKDVLVYGTYSQGYKTGGFVSRVQNPTPEILSFGPEKATTFEIGVKSRVLGRRLQLNAAAYTTNYENIQLNFQLSATPTIQNAGTARIKGIELEATALLSDALTVTSSVSYTDARFTSVLGPATVPPSALQAGVFVGSALPKTPDWKVNLSPRYQIGLANGNRLVLTTDYTYQSRTWNDTERTYLLAQPSTHLLSASVAYALPDDRIRLTVGGTNLLSERFITNGLAQLAGGLIYGAYSRPTEWYAKLGFKF